MKSCNKTFHIRFTDEEYEKLSNLAEFTGLTKSGIVRFMVAGISPREKPSEDYFDYYKEMHKVGNLLNQIARNLYYGQVDYKALDEALALYKELSDRILTDKSDFILFVFADIIYHIEILKIRIRVVKQVRIKYFLHTTYIADRIGI
jgi:predicted DNA-binding protein